MLAVPPLRQSSLRLNHADSLRNGIRMVQKGSRELFRRWQSLQVSYRGSRYSCECLLALDEYMENTSQLRVAIVVTGAMVPMILLVLSQESLPLGDPRDGWKVNYGFWLRVGILAGMVSCTIAVQAKYMVRAATVTLRQLGLLFTCQALSYPVVSMGLAALVGFPIPFFTLSTIPIFCLLLVIWFTVIVGKQTVRNMLQCRQELIAFAQYMCSQMLIPVVYPIYEVIFYATANTSYELPVILLLPLIKIVMKYIVTLALVHSEDMMPEAVIFTVEFFHAVYLATCMQRTRATITVAIIITVDVAQSVSMLYGLHRRSRTMLARAHRAAGTMDNKESLVSLLRQICGNSEKIGKQNLGGISVRSCLPHTLSSASHHCLNNLEKVQQGRKVARSSSNGSFARVVSLNVENRAKMSLLYAKFHGTAIVPTRMLVFPASEARSTGKRSSRQNSLVYRRSNILREGLEALFTSECLVLVSYLHTTIAMLYANFILVMVYLPSAKYHTELHNVTRENVADTVKSVFIFGILEFVSFALLAIMLQRKYGLQAFYLLAFVLETQVALIQSKVMMWMLVILAFRVVHFGVDFTLQFTWMEDPAK